MSTEKLQAIHNTVAEILSDPASPPSPHTFFDEEPNDAEQVIEQASTLSDNRQQSAESLIENFGKPTTRKFGIAPNEIRETQIARDSANDSVQIARQAIAAQVPGASQGDAGNQLLKQLSKLSQESAKSLSNPQTASVNKVRPEASGNRISFSGWGLRGFAGILLATGIGVAGVVWWGSRGDAARTAPSQPAALAQPAPAAGATSPELAPLLQSMARDLAGLGKEIEQLKTGRERLIRDNANLSEQLKGSQEELTRRVVGLSEKLKANQEQMARDNASAAEQVRVIREQLANVSSRVSEQNAASRIAAAPPRPAALAVRKPVPTLSSPQAPAQPKPEKPKLTSATRPPAPAPAR